VSSSSNSPDKVTRPCVKDMACEKNQLCISLRTWILVRQVVHTTSIGMNMHTHSDTAPGPNHRCPNHCPTSCWTNNNSVLLIHPSTLSSHYELLTSCCSNKKLCCQTTILTADCVDLIKRGQKSYSHDVPKLLRREVGSWHTYI